MSNYTGMAAAPASSAAAATTTAAASSSGPAPPASLTPGAIKVVKKASTVGGNKKGTSAERRATHNAVERARRESLNVRFLQLAASLPSTCSVRRPSKSLIVNRSLEFVEQALNADSLLRQMVEDLFSENKSIRQELNQYRTDNGQSARSCDVDKAKLPKPLSANSFKADSQKALASLSRGSFSLAGDFDDDNSGRASNSSLSSTGSPPDARQSHVHHGGGGSSSAIGYRASPGMAESVPTNNTSGHIFIDALNLSQPHSSDFHTFSSPSYYMHDSTPSADHQNQMQQPQHQRHLGTLGDLHRPAQQTSQLIQAQQPQQQHGYLQPQQAQYISSQQGNDAHSVATPTSAAMLNQLMGNMAYGVPGGEASYESLSGSYHMGVPQHIGLPSSSSSGNDGNDGMSHTNGFASLASNTFFDHRYSNSTTSTSTPNYTTAL